MGDTAGVSGEAALPSVLPTPIDLPAAAGGTEKVYGVRFSPPPRQAVAPAGAAGDDSAVHLATAFRVVRKVYSEFGDDVGVFSVFFLNIVQMDVGECLYMPQNTPHAYLSGDIVECMATS